MNFLLIAIFDLDAFKSMPTSEMSEDVQLNYAVPVDLNLGICAEHVGYVFGRMCFDINPDEQHTALQILGFGPRDKARIIISFYNNGFRILKNDEGLPDAHVFDGMQQILKRMPPICTKHINERNFPTFSD